MRYSDEQIDEVIQSYLRTKNKSYVSKKYKINLHTVRYWIDRYEAEKKLEEYAKELASKAMVLKYYDEVKNYDEKNYGINSYALVAKKFGLPIENIKDILDDYRDEIFFLTPEFKKIKQELNRLLPFFAKAYEETDSYLILEKVLLIEMYLGKDDDYVLEKYNAPYYLVNRVRKSF
ncbi:helix-turn-helix domain-containing protein [Acinetobacter baumannii]